MAQGDHPYDADDDYIDGDLDHAIEPAYEPSHEAADDPTEQVAAEPSRSRVRRRKAPVETEDLLDRLHDVISGARSLPLSASASINRDEVLDLIEEARTRLPEELRDARWLRKERDEYLAKMEADGDALLAEARTQAERMVARTEVVKSAEHRARHILDSAEAQARRLRLETEDYCDQKLAGFEVVLERTLSMVANGRAKLQATNIDHPPAQGGSPQSKDW